MIKYTIFLLTMLMAAAPSAIAQSDITPEAGYDTDADTDEVECVPYCVSRTLSGRCTNWGADYCAYGPGVACILQCQQRSIQGRCTAFSRDYCGVYPDCSPYCTRRSVGGRCLSWGRDQCRSFWDF